MAQFYVSPGVYVTERDLSVTAGSVPATQAGFAGVFRWGPVGIPVAVDSEPVLVNTFGTPKNFNAETFFTAANFLSYARPLKVVRVANTSGSSGDMANTVTNAIAGPTNPANTVVINSIIGEPSQIQGKSFDSSVTFVARYPGALGNSLRVSVCDSVAAYNSTVNLTPNTNIDSGNTNITFAIGSNTAIVKVVPSIGGTGSDSLAVVNLVANNINVGDNIRAGNNTIGTQYLKVTAVGTPTAAGANATVTVSFDRNYTLSTNTTSTSIDRSWEFFNVVNKAPGTSDYQASFGSNTSVTDQVHVVVVDQNGLFTGKPGEILETFQTGSRNNQAKGETGKSIFYKNIINSDSNYIWAASDPSSSATGNNSTILTSAYSKPLNLQFIKGQDGQDEYTVPLSVLCAGYDKFANSEEIDIALLLQGIARDGVNGTALGNYLINNIAEQRKDCIVCISPESTDVVQAGNFAADNVVAFRNSLVNTSYAVLDSGYKYMYDRYNDVYRYVPLNGDIGGIMARSDYENDPWMSPAGTTRGKLKGVVKLAWNPTQSQRDTLYKNDINPVVSLSGQGPVLYGDKTLLGKNSSFDKINVRKLFIVVEKAISAVASSFMWEFNNPFTQSQFTNTVEPYLRDVQSRGGIYDFEVVANSVNNTPEIIDSNGFVGHIIISPARSIDKIQLNFISTRTGTQFEEIISNL